MKIFSRYSSEKLLSTTFDVLKKYADYEVFEFRQLLEGPPPVKVADAWFRGTDQQQEYSVGRFGVIDHISERGVRRMCCTVDEVTITSDELHTLGK